MPTCCGLSRGNPYWISMRSQERARSRRLNHSTSWFDAMSQYENKWTNSGKRERRLKTRLEKIKVLEARRDLWRILGSNHSNQSKSCVRPSMNGKKRQTKFVNSGFSGRSAWSF